MERLGIVDEMVERREAMVAPLSPGARHQAFPNKYARPVPRDQVPHVDKSPKLLAEIERLKSRVAELKAENARLRDMLDAKAGVPRSSASVPIIAVMSRFCDAMNAAGLQIGDEKWSLALLRTSRRAHPISHPRHVCMWLVRTICAEPSFPAIGHAFGGKDHTTVMHAMERAPSWMAADPSLFKVATEVLRSFGAAAARLEEGGKP
jgi:hypothetical protein